MKTGLATFVISFNFPYLSFFTVLFAYVVFLVVVVLWLEICVEVPVEEFREFKFFVPPSHPSILRGCFSIPTQNSLS